MEFKYIAVDKKGKKVSNTIIADNRQEAISSLKSGGLRVTKLVIKKDNIIVRNMKKVSKSFGKLTFKLTGGKLKSRRLTSFKEELEMLGYEAMDISNMLRGINKDNFDVNKFKEKLNLTDIQIEKITSGKVNENIITSVNLDKDKKDNFKFNFGVPMKDIITFTEMLSVLLENDVVMIDALETVQKNLSNKKLRGIVDSIIYDLTKGREFSTALAMHSDVFPPLYISMVNVGETTGSELPRALDDVVKFLKMRQQVKREVMQASIYPSFVVGALIAILVFMNFYIIPRFRELFTSMDFELPILTRFIFSISENLIFIFFGIVAVIVFAIYLLYKVEYTRQRAKTIVDYLALKTPVIKGAVLTSLMYQMTMTLSITLRNGISIQESLDLLNNVIGNKYVKKEIGEIYYSLEKGKDISDAFGEKVYVTDIVKMAISSGEKSGRLNETLGRVSVYYEKELEAKIAVLLQTIVPVSIIFLAAFIAPFIIGIYLPLISLTDQMGTMR